MSRFLDIAEDVLRYSQGKALTVREIWSRAEAWALVPPEIAGVTPMQTLKSKLSVDLRTSGSASRFARTGPGRFVLRGDLAGRAPYEAAPPALPGSASEPVVCLPVNRLHASQGSQGIRGSERVRREVLEAGDVIVRSRDIAERSYDAKQLIVYVVVRRRSQVLVYKRGTRTRVEDYLKGSRCVGFGGHVNESDLRGTIFSTDSVGAAAAAARELGEELKLPADERTRLLAGVGLTFRGVINDDSSDTGRRHLGVVYEYEVGPSSWWDSPMRGEQSITRLEWIEPQASGLDLTQFEYWSQLVLTGFYGSSAKGAARYRVLHPSALQRPHVVCLVGPVGSGKTEAAADLENLFGYSLVNSGSAIADLMGIPRVPVTPREEFQAAANRYIGEPGGVARLADALVREIAPGANYVIDGIRQRETLRRLREALGETRLCVVYVHTLPDVAFGFFRQRERPDIDAAAFYEIRQAPVEAEVESLLSEADVVVYNWRGTDRYRSLLRTLFTDPSP